MVNNIENDAEYIPGFTVNVICVDFKQTFNELILNNPNPLPYHFTDVVVEHLLGFILWKLIIVCENYRFRKISLIIHNTHSRA